MKIVWPERAQLSLDAAIEYIFEQSPGAAEATVARIFAAVEHLASFPRLGRPGHKIGRRELVVHGSPFVVIYSIDGDEIRILRVVHGATDWQGASFE